MVAQSVDVVGCVFRGVRCYVHGGVLVLRLPVLAGPCSALGIAQPSSMCVPCACVLHPVLGRQVGCLGMVPPVAWALLPECPKLPCLLPARMSHPWWTRACTPGRCMQVAEE